jgi:hypothetical protein
MKTAFVKRLILSVALVLSSTLPAQADLFNGQTVQMTHEFPTLGTITDTRTFVVGPGVEAFLFPASTQITNIDFSDTNIFADFRAAGTTFAATFNGIHVFDLLGTIPDFVSVTIDSATNVVGFDSSRITFDADNIWINAQNLPFTADSVISVNVAAIPEPEIYAMLCVGLGLLGWVGRRKNLRERAAV